MREQKKGWGSERKSCVTVAFSWWLIFHEWLSHNNSTVAFCLDFCTKFGWLQYLWREKELPDKHPYAVTKKFTIEPYSTGVCRGCDMDERCEVSKPHFKTQSNGTVARGGDEEKRWGFVSMAYCVKPANNGEPILHSGGWINVVSFLPAQGETVRSVAVCWLSWHCGGRFSLLALRNSCKRLLAWIWSSLFTEHGRLEVLH